MRIFALDRVWRGKPPTEIKSLRELHLGPHTDAFFAWAEAEYERVRDQRGLLRTALGYAVRQRGPLTRFYDDGRLRLDNNASEREQRRVAVGRNYAEAPIMRRATGGPPPSAAHWPRERYLELCPRDWTATRAGLDLAELELGPLAVPPLPAAEQPAAR